MAPAALTRDGVAGWLLNADSPTPVAQLEDQAAELAKRYRGQLEVLSGAETDAKAAAGRVQRLDRQFVAAHDQLARLAASSYMGSAPDQALAFFAGGNPQQVLGRSTTIEYLARQRDARAQHLHQLTLAAQSAQQDAQAKVARLRQMIQTLAGQQQRVKHLLAQFHPESPVIGDSITPRRRGVRDEVDRRFGPFSAIGDPEGLRHRGVGPGQRLPARHHVHHLPAADLGRPDGVLRLGPDGEPRQHHREPLRPRAHLGVLETRRRDKEARGGLGEEHDRLAGQDVRRRRVEAVVTGPDQGRPRRAVGLVPPGLGHRDLQPCLAGQVGRAVGPGGDQRDREQVAGRELAAAVEYRARSAAGEYAIEDRNAGFSDRRWQQRCEGR